MTTAAALAFTQVIIAQPAGGPGAGAGAGAGGSEGSGIGWIVLGVGLAIVLAFVLIFILIAIGTYGKLWFQAYMSSADVSIMSLIGMGFRRIPPKTIVLGKI